MRYSINEYLYVMSSCVPTFTVKLKKKRQILNRSDIAGLIRSVLEGQCQRPVRRRNLLISICSQVCTIYQKSCFHLQSSFLYIRKLHPGPFLNLILQSNILSKDLTALHIYEFLHRPPKGFISQLCPKTPQCMLGLFFHQVLFHSYMVFSICRCLEQAADVALTQPAHHARLMPASPGICKTQHCAFLCHISKLICRNTF